MDNYIQHNTRPVSYKKTVSAPAVLDLYDALLSHNIITEQSLQHINWSRDKLSDVESRVPALIQTQLWQYACNQKDIPDIGLRIGQQINSRANGLLSHLLQHASTLSEALALFADNIELMSQCEKVNLQFTHWGCRISYSFSPEQETCIPAIERSLSAALSWAQHLTGKTIYPRHVSLSYPKVKYVSCYKSLFGNNISFKQKTTYIDINKADLDTPIKTANCYLKNIIFEHVQKLKKTLEPDQSTSQKVKALIEKNISLGTASSETIAEELNISRQTLHRYLQKEGTSFRVLLEEIRKDKAREYLVNADVRLEELGFLLGYKESSAFFRAFKSWFNSSPLEYKSKLAN